MPDLILYNGIIHTMDNSADASANVSAIAITGHQISAVGTDEQILPLAGSGKDCRIIDLQGKCVVPGFTDSHCHILHTGLAHLQVPLGGARSVEEIVELVREFIEKYRIPEGTWVQGTGYNHNLFSDRRQPTRYDLDRISVSHPILIDRVCGHIGAANTLALSITGFDRDDLQIEGGGGILRDESGIPTGVIVETALDMIHRCIPAPSPEQVRKAILSVFEEASSYGITAMHSDDSCGVDIDTVMETYRQMEKEGLSTVRVWEEVETPRPAHLKAFLEKGLRTGSGSRFFKIGNIKLFADGSLGARTALMREDYCGCPGDRGIQVYTDENLCEMAHMAHEAGMQVAIHAIGDGAAAQCVRAFSFAHSFDDRDLRDRIVHCQFADDELLDLMAENHICADIQPPFTATDYPIVRDRVGSRENGSYAWRSMLQRGIPLGGGSDTPVEPFDPIWGIHCAVNRTDRDGNPSGGWHPEEKLTALEALRIYTMGGAYLSMEEDARGSIAPGKYADLAVLDRDILAVPPEEIRFIKNVMTVMDGRIVWSAENTKEATHMSDKILLYVPQILQNPELPNGCEITSCCEVLQFLGYPADKCDLADHYLPRSEKWYGTDPDQFYMGDPHLDDSSPETGYYCFAGPVVTAANKYLSERGGAHYAVDLTGASQEMLAEQLRKGRPFIFWASLHFKDIQFDERGAYELPGGRTHRVFHQLHCMVCKGMDDTSFYIADPLDFNTSVPKDIFMKIYHQLGDRAVVILPAGEKV